MSKGGGGYVCVGGCSAARTKAGDEESGGVPADTAMVRGRLRAAAGLRGTTLAPSHVGNQPPHGPHTTARATVSMRIDRAIDI